MMSRKLKGDAEADDDDDNEDEDEDDGDDDDDDDKLAHVQRIPQWCRRCGSAPKMEVWQVHTIMECRTHMSMTQALQSRPQNGTVSKSCLRTA